MKTLVLILFTIGLCLAADTTAEDSSTTLKLRLLPSSDSQQVSVKPTDGAVDTAVVEIKEQNGQWRLMTLAHRGYWSYTAASSMMGLRFPLSFRLTSVNGEQITLRNAVAMLLGRDVVFDSHTQYSGGTSEPTSEPTSAPTSEPTSEPTSGPTSEPTGTAKPKPPKPTSVPTNTPTSAPTDAPTQAPTDAPTDAPTTQTPTDAPTTAPTEPAPTEPPTAAPTAPQTVPPTTAPTEPQQTTPRPTEPAPTEPPTTTAPTDTPTTEPDVPTQEPSALPTEVPPTEAPATEAPATEAPATEAPATEAPATEAPATEAPTEPATEAPTEAPATEAPTEAPTQPATEAPTQPPTEAATEAPATGTDAPSQGSSSCSTKTKVMVPLYVYPGAAWDALITGAQYAQTVAIINPYNGPRPTPDSAYTTYMQKFHDAGIDLVGYVYTQYGNRDINVVKADINTYAQNYPYVVGIFLDEAAADASKLPYYQELYNYIMGFPGYKYDVINPGIIPDYGYLGASTQIVSFENYGSVAASTSAPSYGNCNNKEHFVAIAHTIGSGDMRTIVDQLDRMDYFGYIYVTDGAGGCCTYNNLCSYYVDSAQYIGSL